MLCLMNIGEHRRGWYLYTRRIGNDGLGWVEIFGLCSVANER